MRQKICDNGALPVNPGRDNAAKKACSKCIYRRGSKIENFFSESKTGHGSLPNRTSSLETFSARITTFRLLGDTTSCPTVPSPHFRRADRGIPHCHRVSWSTLARSLVCGPCATTRRSVAGHHAGSRANDARGEAGRVAAGAGIGRTGQHVVMLRVVQRVVQTRGRARRLAAVPDAQ